MQGMAESDIKRTTAEMRAVEPHTVFSTFSPDRKYLPQQVVRAECSTKSDMS